MEAFPSTGTRSSPPRPLQTHVEPVYKARKNVSGQENLNSRRMEGIPPVMKNVQIVFNIQVPDHVSEDEVNSRLHQVISSLMAQEFGGNSLIDQPMGHPQDGHDGQVGHA